MKVTIQASDDWASVIIVLIQLWWTSLKKILHINQCNVDKTLSATCIIYNVRHVGYMFKSTA